MGCSSADTSANFSSECDLEVTYDSFGRMNYHPFYHKNNKMPWKSEDIQYIIDWYEKVGPEEISFALERTIKSVQQKATQLRRCGLLGKGRTYVPRIKKRSS